MTAHVIRGDARALPLPDASVELIVTSPPYFALRSYTDGGEHYAGQIGSEPTPAEYVAALIDCTREWCRVLKPSGSLWVNLGDKYSSGSGGQSNLTALGQRLGSGGGQKRDSAKTRSAPAAGFPPKTLLGLPWRYALACIDQLGLILRAEVIWSKPNGLPESVTDRVRRSHEQWFHFTREPRYYSAVDEIREPHATHTLYCAEWEKGKPGGRYVRARSNADRMDGGNRTSAAGPNPLGKLPGSVWEIASEPLKVPADLGVDHFAAFPTEWPRRIIAGWSPPGICDECGEGRRPIPDVSYEHVNHTTNGKSAAGERGHAGVRTQRTSVVARKQVAITGYACACPEATAPTRPSVILDPFGGTGTVALVASALGRIGITVDMSADYCRLATWRTTDPAQRAKVLGVPKPPVQVSGQLDLLGEAL